MSENVLNPSRLVPLNRHKYKKAKLKELPGWKIPVPNKESYFYIGVNKPYTVKNRYEVNWHYNSSKNFLPKSNGKEKTGTKDDLSSISPAPSQASLLGPKEKYSKEGSLPKSSALIGTRKRPLTGVQRSKTDNKRNSLDFIPKDLQVKEKPKTTEKSLVVQIPTLQTEVIEDTHSVEDRIQQKKQDSKQMNNQIISNYQKNKEKRSTNTYNRQISYKNLSFDDQDLSVENLDIIPMHYDEEKIKDETYCKKQEIDIINLKKKTINLNARKQPYRHNNSNTSNRKYRIFNEKRRSSDSSSIPLNSFMKNMFKSILQLCAASVLELKMQNKSSSYTEISQISDRLKKIKTESKANKTQYEGFSNISPNIRARNSEPNQVVSNSQSILRKKRTIHCNSSSPSKNSAYFVCDNTDKLIPSEEQLFKSLISEKRNEREAIRKNRKYPLFSLGGRKHYSFSNLKCEFVRNRRANRSEPQKKKSKYPKMYEIWTNYENAVRELNLID